jgi:hypothetical protein
VRGSWRKFSIEELENLNSFLNCNQNDEMKKDERDKVYSTHEDKRNACRIIGLLDFFHCPEF